MQSSYSPVINCSFWKSVFSMVFDSIKFMLLIYSEISQCLN
jgi:hypothetical protein